MARINTMRALKTESGPHVVEPQMARTGTAAPVMPKLQGRPGGGHAPSERVVPGVPVSNLKRSRNE